MALALVTGGTGFVGSHIVRALLADGHRVRVLHREHSRLDALAGLPYESAIGTLSDLDAMRAACAGVDWTFHVAAVADYWRADASRLFETNVEGTRRLLTAARDTGVARVIFTSSAAAVGLDDHAPTDETAGFNLPPQHFPYGYSKHLAEGVVAEAVAAGQDVVTLNPVVIMGPGDLNLISGSFILQIQRYGPLTPWTSGGVAVVDVRDVARWHVLAARHGHTGERYILGTANYSYRRWFDMIAETLGVHRPRLYTPDALAPLVAQVITLARRLGIATPIDAAQARLGVRKVYFRFDKAWSAFGPPRISMAQSLRDTTRWYRGAGLLPPGQP